MAVQAVNAYALKAARTLGLGHETTTGTGVNPSKLLYFRGEFGLAAKQPQLDTDQETGRLDPIDPQVELETVDGDLEVLTDLTAFAEWLQLMFGAATAGVYSLPSTLPSATLYRYHTDIGQYATYTGVHVAKWSLAAAPGQQLLVSKLSLVGRHESWSNSAPSGSPTETPPVAPFYRGDVTVTLATVAETPVAVTTPVLSAELDFDFGLALDQYPLAGVNYKTLFLPGKRAFTGKLTALIPDRILIDGALAQTPYSLTITLAKAGGSTSLALAFPRVLFERTVPKASGGAGLVLELPFRATRPLITDTLFTATVT